MGEVRHVARADRRLDVLARDDTSHTVAEVSGRHRRAVGKARITTARNRRELAPESQKAELLLCCDAIPDSGSVARPRKPQRSDHLSAQLQALSRFFESRYDRKPARCNRKSRRSRCSATGCVWSLLAQACVAARQLNPYHSIRITRRRRCRLLHRCQHPEPCRRHRRSSSHARLRQAPCDVSRSPALL